MSVAIIDYGSGNLHSAAKAFERAARDTGDRIVVTSDAEAVAKAERIVLPGRRRLRRLPARARRGARHGGGVERGGDRQRHAVSRHLRRLPADGGARAGESDDRGARLDCRRRGGDRAGPIPELKIPHMGWNTLDVANEHPLLAGIPTGEDGLDAYFVHSFHVIPRDPRRTSSRPPITAGRSRPSSAATTMPARSSIRKRARTLGLGADREFSEVEAVSGGRRILSQGRGCRRRRRVRGCGACRTESSSAPQPLIRLLRSHLLPHGRRFKLSPSAP